MAQHRDRLVVGKVSRTTGYPIIKPSKYDCIIVE